ncbi:hypothetical protein TELCIR_20404, partial [Teladorsagia circumcincta]
MTCLGRKLSNEECLVIKPDKQHDTFCTLETADNSVCTGDSGAGITANYYGRQYLIGIVSHGDNCEELFNTQGNTAG